MTDHDFRRAAQAAFDDEPPSAIDPQSVLATGRRAVRRRRAARAGVVSAAGAAVAVAVLVGAPAALLGGETTLTPRLANPTTGPPPNGPSLGEGVTEQQKTAPGLDGRTVCDSPGTDTAITQEFDGAALDQSFGGYLTDTAGRGQWSRDMAGMRQDGAGFEAPRPDLVWLIEGLALCWYSGSFPNDDVEPFRYVVLSVPLDPASELPVQLLVGSDRPLPVFAPPPPDAALVPPELKDADMVVLPQPTTAADGQQQTVQVFFAPTEGPQFRCDSVEPVTRQVTMSDAPTAALREVFRGPTPDERDRGLRGPETGQVVRSVRVENGAAYVDLDPSLERVNNVSTTCFATMLVSQMTATLLQFSDINEAFFAIEGDPSRFYGLLERVCPDRLRDGDTCNPQPFADR